MYLSSIRFRSFCPRRPLKTKGFSRRWCSRQILASTGTSIITSRPTKAEFKIRRASTAACNTSRRRSRCNREQKKTTRIEIIVQKSAHNRFTISGWTKKKRSIKLGNVRSLKLNTIARDVTLGVSYKKKHTHTNCNGNKGKRNFGKVPKKTETRQEVW